MGIDIHDPRPAYLQVADDLRREIAEGRLRPGEQLPSGRELARRYGIAPMTVQHALQVLKDEGLIVSRQGRGAFVRQTPRVEESQPGHSPAYEAVMQQLQAMQEDLQRLDDRLSRLEEMVTPDESRSRKRSR